MGPAFSAVKSLSASRAWVALHQVPKSLYAVARALVLTEIWYNYHADVLNGQGQ